MNSYCKKPSVNKSSLDKMFDELVVCGLSENVEEYECARYIPVLGFLAELLFEISGIFIVYFMIDFLSPYITGRSINNNYLYSMLLIPFVYSFKKLPDIFKSLFVKIGISDNYVICKRGFIKKFIDKLYIKNIDNIEIRTTIFGEWFNYGTIDLYSFGGRIRLPFIKNPCVVYRRLNRKDEKRNKKD